MIKKLPKAIDPLSEHPYHALVFQETTFPHAARYSGHGGAVSMRVFRHFSPGELLERQFLHIPPASRHRSTRHTDPISISSIILSLPIFGTRVSRNDISNDETTVTSALQCSTIPTYWELLDRVASRHVTEFRHGLLSALITAGQRPFFGVLSFCGALLPNRTYPPPTRVARTHLPHDETNDETPKGQPCCSHRKTMTKPPDKYPKGTLTCIYICH